MLKYSSLICFTLLMLSCNHHREAKPDPTGENTTLVNKALSKAAETEKERENMPLADSIRDRDVYAMLRRVDSLRDYVPVPAFQPNYISSDFSGDGSPDHAILTRSTRDDQYYIIFIHSEGTHHRVGGGAGMTDGDLSLEWIDGIKVFSERETNRSIIDENSGDILGTAAITLKRDAVALQYVDVGTVGLLYWDGSTYMYIHQFD